MGEVLKIGIVGSRDFGDLTRVGRFVEIMHEQHGEIEIVSGGAKGVDTAAIRRGLELGLICTEFKPDPKVHPFVKAANERNTQIVEYSDWVYAFWNVKSTGTMDTMRKALTAEKLVAIYTPKGAFTNSRISGPA